MGPANTKDDCDLTGTHPDRFCPFDLTHQATATQPLVLKRTGAADLPGYLPLWTVAVHGSIMRDHDDISNPAIVRFIAQLFRAAYEQEEVIHWRHQAGAASPPATHGEPASETPEH
jgi:hypothetical protein